MGNEREARTIEEGRVLTENVVEQLGGSLSAWEPCSPETLGYWEYANASFNGAVVRVGVSSGGVVSLDGHPFTPDGLMNVTQKAVLESFSRKIANSISCADAELRNGVQNAREQDLAAAAVDDVDPDDEDACRCAP